MKKHLLIIITLSILSCTCDKIGETKCNDKEACILIKETYNCNKGISVVNINHVYNESIESNKSLDFSIMPSTTILEISINVQKNINFLLFLKLEHIFEIHLQKNGCNSKNNRTICKHRFYFTNAQVIQKYSIKCTHSNSCLIERSGTSVSCSFGNIIVDNCKIDKYPMIKGRRIYNFNFIKKNEIDCPNQYETSSTKKPSTSATNNSTTQTNSGLTTTITETTKPTIERFSSSHNTTKFITLLTTNNTNISQFVSVTNLINNKSDNIVLTKTTTPTVIVLNSSQNITLFTTNNRGLTTTKSETTEPIIERFSSSQNITKIITTPNDTNISKFVNVTSIINNKSDSIILTKTTTSTFEELNFITSETTSLTTTQPFNDLITTIIITETTTPTIKVLNSSDNITEFNTLLKTNDTNISQFVNVTSLINNISDSIILTKNATPSIIVLNSSQNITHFSTILTTNEKNSLQLLSATSPPYNKSIIILSIGIPVLFILAVFPLVHYFLVTKPQLKANANLELTSSVSISYYTERTNDSLNSEISNKKF
jgi:hypothetical protein